jgi:hypothetical protein
LCRAIEFKAAPPPRMKRSPKLAAKFKALAVEGEFKGDIC